MFFFVIIINYFFVVFISFLFQFNFASNSHQLTRLPQPLPQVRHMTALLTCLLLPSSHLSTLRYLMRHLQSVASQSDYNKMDIANLAVCMAPNLLYGASRTDKVTSTEVSGTPSPPPMPTLPLTNLFKPPPQLNPLQSLASPPPPPPPSMPTLPLTNLFTATSPTKSSCDPLPPRVTLT